MGNCFIIKHDFESLTALPNYIWNTEEPKLRPPRGYKQIELGDRWVAFAYTSSDKREQRVSAVTGFFECVRQAEYTDIPAGGVPYSSGKNKAWLIKGKRSGWQPVEAVTIPPIGNFLSKPLFTRSTINKILPDEFEAIRKVAKSNYLPSAKIPLLGRAPQNEQELLAIVAYGHKKLGISQIVRIRKGFPDVLVKLEGHDREIHLELEVTSEGFCSHGHHNRVQNQCFEEDGKAVAILCWIDQNKEANWRSCVHRIFDLQELIRERKKIRYK